jgi:hypothetical protein
MTHPGIVSTCASVLGAALLIVFPSALAAEIRESPKNEIGYATVAGALDALRSRPGNQLSKQGGWTIISEPASSSIWSFTPSDHPAYPSAVKRSLVSVDGSMHARVKAFNAQAGAATERRILKVTWTKDPANSPAPGVYAAVDLASHFERIDRHCGYIVLYQLNAAMPFLVVRQEDNFMTNESARQIAAQHSSHSVDESWSRLSSNCPSHAADAAGSSSNTHN